jgi:hypothetical protein
MKFFNLVHVGALVSSASLPTVLATFCRYLPGDDCWPAVSQWKTLNSTVGGRLIATYPLGSLCHDPAYDAAKCASLQTQWLDPQLQ